MTFAKYIPGLCLLLSISFLSNCIARLLPDFIGAVGVAIVLGIIVNNILRPKSSIFGPGIKFGVSTPLKLGIVFLGAGISLQEVFGIGLRGLSIILVLIGLVFVFTFYIGSKLNVSTKRRLLIAVGISICGNTAIATTAPLVDAGEDDVAMAISIVTLFGVLAVFLYPLIGKFLGMPESLFGAWAATAINDTSQVVAAGFSYGEIAGKIATMIKLTRNIMIVPVVLLTGYFYRRGDVYAQSGTPQLMEVFPKFILGFLLFVVLNSIGLIAPSVSESLIKFSKVLILVALSGVGLSVDFKQFRKIGLKPFVLGFTTEIFIAFISYVLVNIALT